MLQLTEVPEPIPSANEVLLHVAAAGVNRADILQRLGRYPAPAGVPADIPGLEAAGVIEAVGGDVAEWTPGDRAMALLAGGAYAELVAVPAAQVLPIPDGWTFEQAAAVPEAYLTAFDALEQVGTREHEHVLVHAVASGVGVALLHLCHARGAVVAGTSRTPAKLERMLREGLDRPIAVSGVFSPNDELTNWADVICDLVGGGYLSGNLLAAAPKGRIIVIGLTGGRAAELDMGLLLRKRLTLVGTTLRNRSVEEKGRLVATFRRVVLPLFETGRIGPVVDRIFRIEDAAEAHRYMESNRSVGSIVMSWDAARQGGS
jgi:putative PIG3 family NAD(P)H quinone oxidoreductase